MTSTIEAPVKAKRKGWTQGEIASLVWIYRSDNLDMNFHLPNRTHEECITKLIELGLKAPIMKPTLTEHDRGQLMEFLGKFATMEDPRKTLMIRFLVSSLQAMLPKRAPKS